MGGVLEVSGVVDCGEAVMRKRKPDYRGAAFWFFVWVLALILTGLAGTSDVESSADLTIEVDRVAVTECRQ